MEALATSSTCPECRGDGYRVWDYGGIRPVDITFLPLTAIVTEPASGHAERFHLKV